MATSCDAARYILNKKGPLGAMKLQKLVYYSQAYNLAWREKVLFSDPVEAWQHGPVAPMLYDFHAGKVEVAPEDVIGDPDALSENDKRVVDSVLKSLGVLSGWELRARSHREAPWRDAYDPKSFPRKIISTDAIKDFYGEDPRRR